MPTSGAAQARSSCRWPWLPLAATKVFPSYEVLGWYAVGPALTEVEHGVHRQIALLNESPLLLHLDDTHVSASQRELPLAVYIADDKGAILLLRLTAVVAS